jgi:DNA-binding CsgD family transcriptional regulator
MRVALVGSRDARALLRTQLASGSIEVVAEYPTLSEADAAGTDIDALVLAPDFPSASLPRDDRRVGRQPDLQAEALTARELDVLELLAEGLPNKTIARRLGISDQTVKFHVASIMGKLGAANRTDAVRRALRRGLLTL